MISTTEPEETDPHCSKARPGHGDGAGGAGGGAQETPGQRAGTPEGSCVRCASGLLCAYCWCTVRQAYYVHCAYAHRRLHTQTAWVPDPHTVDQEEKVLKAQGAPGS